MNPHRAPSAVRSAANDTEPERLPVRPPPPVTAKSGRTNYFCPVCGHEFLPDEIGKKPYCRRCGYLES